MPAEVAGGHVLLDELVFAPDVASVAEALGTGRSPRSPTTAYRLGAAPAADLAGGRAGRAAGRHAHAALGGPGAAATTCSRCAARWSPARSRWATAMRGVEALLEELDGERARLERFFRALSLDRAGGLPALTLAVRQLRALAEG